MFRMTTIARNGSNRGPARPQARAGKLIAVALAALTLGACANEYGGKQTAGTLVGAAGGGLLGAQVGKGRGQLAAVAAGTLLGAILGNQVGASLDRADRLALARAHDSASTGPLNEPVYWRNEHSGNYGTVTPVREGRSASGYYCREYQHTIYVGGKAERGYGTACQQPDGSWQIVNG